MTTKKDAPKKGVVATKKTVSKVSAKKIVKKTLTSKKTATSKKIQIKKVAAKSHKTLSASKTIVEAKKVSKGGYGLKRASYMFLSIILGILIGIFVHLFIELVYMKNMMASDLDLSPSYFLGMPSYLPSFAEPLFLLAGLILGIWVGKWGWKFAYIDRRHRSTRIA